MQRFKDGSDYFQLTGQFREGYITECLAEFVAYYSNRISYKEVEYLLKRLTGTQLLCDQSIWKIVQDKAASISLNQKEQIKAVLEKGHMPKVESKVDIYNKRKKELLLFEDAIQVKEQKSERDNEAKSKRTRVTTDVVMIENKDGRFHYLTAGINEQAEELFSLDQALQAQVIAQYGKRQKPLPLVLIGDGAKTIRNRLLSVFSQPVTVILDWYHLEKKVLDLMSMVVRGKKQRQPHLDFILERLWKGQTRSVIKYISTQVKATNPDKLQELISYLQKHKAEIINYERRQAAGKTIGSGRMERAVDQVIGIRQKGKAMSWSRKGSKALAILKVVELNGHWNSLWNSPAFAA